jgi:hypothetical protein
MSTNVHKFKNSSRLGSLAAILAIGLLLAASSAEAIVFDLTSDHCTGTCGTPPFGDVTLTQNGTTVDVTVHLNSPNFFVKTGSADDMAFKFNATGVALTDITVDQNAPKPLAAEFSAQPNGFNGDGTGQFEFGIDCPTCGGGASDQFNSDIIFHVAGATIADLTVPNNLGNVFVADIISNSEFGGNGNTGPVDATTPRNVPDSGSTALLLGLGLFGLGFVRMPLRKKA